MNRGVLYSLVLVLLAGLLFVGNLLTGSVHIPMNDVWAILTGTSVEVKPSWVYIVWESRLPQALTAMLSGAALAASGLLLQTTFHNPLAGPDVFGISSGAGLAVAVVMLGIGGGFSFSGYGISGFVAVLLAALAGALAVTALLLFFSTLVRNNVLLLIVGIMIGYV